MVLVKQSSMVPQQLPANSTDDIEMRVCVSASLVLHHCYHYHHNKISVLVHFLKVGRHTPIKEQLPPSILHCVCVCVCVCVCTCVLQGATQYFLF